MHFTYDWVRARQDDQLKEAMTRQELNKLRPAKKSILSRIHSRLGSFAVPDVLHEPAHEAKTTA